MVLCTHGQTDEGVSGAVHHYRGNHVIGLIHQSHFVVICLVNAGPGHTHLTFALILRNVQYGLCHGKKEAGL